MHTEIYHVCDICGRKSAEEEIIRVCEGLGVPEHQSVGTKVRLHHTIGLSHPLAWRQYKSQYFCLYNGFKEPDGEYYLEASIVEIQIVSNARALPIATHWTQSIALSPDSLAHCVLYRLEFLAPRQDDPRLRTPQSVWMIGPFKTVRLNLCASTPQS